ncbi:hypothetical protein J2S46_000143 [Kitasatospora herbaricolor]|nr:hypothetical protein [Kitasatospora herbaricolor]MDQ0305587.1 hypothetical protein [Kitasatospora herbaricolor]
MLSALPSAIHHTAFMRPSHSSMVERPKVTATAVLAGLRPDN